MINNNYIPASTSLIVNGFERGVIIDLPRNKYEFVPNSISDFLKLLKKQPFKTIYNDTPLEYQSIVIEYLEFCLEKEYVLEIPHEVEKKQFPKLNLQFELPSIISNLVIKLNKDSQINYETIKNVLTFTKCYNIQLIFENDFELQNIDTLLSAISPIGLRSIEIIAPFNPNFNYQTLTDVHKNIAYIFIYSAPTKQVLKEHYFGVQQIYSSTSDFKITYLKSLNFFNVNITLFTESQKHNTYFNRKLFIGSNGEIKNSPESLHIFGNINDIKPVGKILQIINSTKFQSYWLVNKDIIDVCKHCEFRHMCVDNRIPIKRNASEYFMETECNYNPYITKWQEEEGYNTLAECGIITNKEGFKINRKKLNAINIELWDND